jgi:trans-aconitate 2-methyltransferase
MTDEWQPAQYNRFARERSAPFYDLLGLVHPAPGGRAVDFGCGTGRLTTEMHRTLQLSATAGVDRSAAMLAEAPAEPGVEFRQGDLRSVTDVGPVDVVFSNAALQWVGDHPGVLRAWTSLLGSGGQLAVQVPANADHPSHLVAAEVAMESPFLEAFGGEPPPDPVHSVLPPERYATLLDDLGFVEQHVRLQVYGHRLPTSVDVVEWVAGTTLVRFRERLPAELYARYVERYRTRLLEVIGDRSPYFYPFKRILFWARR